ncbi:SDR family NAD(P)-dependent oxidoreductase [Hyphococcus lacteus]|uniref:SDR family oxidoreductase n=1 Tax=Hyphococcus lacteus TaxID=3143536 RepID=A0ABV3Z7D2_9PROT
MNEELMPVARSGSRSLYKPLAGQVAFVSGSGRGLGRSIGEVLMELGADLAIHDISEDAPAQYGEFPSLTAVADAMATGDARAVAVTGDISSENAVNEMVERAERKLGPISILVNCAGGDIGAKGGKPDPNTAVNFLLDDLQAVVNRNLIGTMLLSRAVAPGMAERQSGSIINIASIAAHYGASNEVAYACAKAAIVHYTRCLASEVRTAGVRVNAISPGPAKSARFLATRAVDPLMMEEGPSLNRYATASEIADVVSFLATEQSRFVSGQIIRVDGGAGLYAA